MIDEYAEQSADHSADAWAFWRAIAKGLAYMGALALAAVIVCGAWVW